MGLPYKLADNQVRFLKRMIEDIPFFKSLDDTDKATLERYISIISKANRLPQDIRYGPNGKARLNYLRDKYIAYYNIQQ